MGCAGSTVTVNGSFNLHNFILISDSHGIYYVNKFQLCRSFLKIKVALKAEIEPGHYIFQESSFLSLRQ